MEILEKFVERLKEIFREEDILCDKAGYENNFEDLGAYKIIDELVIEFKNNND